MDDRKLKTLKRYLDLVNTADTSFQRAVTEQDSARQADFMCCGRVILSSVDWQDFAALCLEFEQESLCVA